MPPSDPNIPLLRHMLATVAYRGGKALRGAPTEFATFKAGPTSKTPGEILAHLGDLFDWALGLADGRQQWHDSSALAWQEGTARWFAALAAFDARLASGTPLGFPAEKLLQGPLADALTHVGQLAMLRRLAGHPMKSENYFQAEIEAGRVGPEQIAPRREFD